MSALNARLEAALESRRSRQMLRSLAPLEQTRQQRKRDLVDFSSNDYLSFARSNTLRDKLVNALRPETEPSPYGPPSSRLLDGNSDSHLQLELRLETFFHARDALLFNSGFDANVGVWSCLPGPDDYVVFDELVHASIHDGMRSSRVDHHRRVAFRHNSLDDLEVRIEQIKQDDDAVSRGLKSVWIAVETLYSMDGDLCPLADMVRLVDRVLPNRNGHFVVDEAHSTGLYGPNGRGLVCALGLEDRITVRLHTFGKAMACSGAVVLANRLIRQYLVNYARPLIYSTAMPHMNVKAIENSIEMLQLGFGDQPARHVHDLAATLIESLSSFLTPTSTVSLPPHLVPPLYQPRLSPPKSSSSIRHPPPSHIVDDDEPPRPTVPPTSSIVPLLTARPRPLSEYLSELGFLVRPITYPTVPRGMERVRVCLHAANTLEQVVALAEGVRRWEDKEKEERRRRERERHGVAPGRTSDDDGRENIRARL